MPGFMGLSGSLRAGSYNTALLRAAEALMPQGASLEIRTPSGVPPYDGDVEANEGIPPAVAELKAAIADAEGLIIATPEYNNGIPGVAKNLIDWLSRPPADIPKVFGDRPVALMGASAGGFGTVLAQTAWLPVLRALGVRTWSGGRLTVARAGNVFDEHGALTDADLRKRLESMLAEFVRFARQGR